MADLHPEVLALIEAGPRRVMDLSLDSIDPSRLETPEEFARRIALRQHEIDERENADLRAEIKAHNDGCAAACKARYEGGACAYRNADGSPRYGNKRCHDCPQEYAIDAAIAAGKGEK